MTKLQKFVMLLDQRPFKTDQNRSRPTAHNGSEGNKDELVATLRDQIAHLKELLANEQSERQEERQERSNYQQMLMMVQKDVQNLRQENDRLKLLEHTKPEATDALRKEDVYSRPTAEEFKVAEEHPPATTKQGKKRFVGVRMLSAAAIIGILFYAAITHGGEWLSSSLEKQISAALKIAGTEPDTRWEAHDQRLSVVR